MCLLFSGLVFSVAASLVSVPDLNECVQSVSGRHRRGLQDPVDGVCLVQRHLEQIPLQLQLLQPHPGGRGDLHHLAFEQGQQGQQRPHA